MMEVCIGVHVPVAVVDPLDGNFQLILERFLFLPRVLLDPECVCLREWVDCS